MLNFQSKEGGRMYLMVYRLREKKSDILLRKYLFEHLGKLELLGKDVRISQK